MNTSFPTHVQYRNSTYYGTFSQQKRHGYGLLVLDNASIIYARWNKNSLNGVFAYISDKLRSFGTFQDNKLDGYNVITTTQQPFRTLYATFRNDKPYGNAVIIQNNQVITVRFVNGQIQEILNKKIIRDKEVYHTLTDIFPNQVHTLEQYLTLITNQSLKSLSNADQFLRYQPLLKTFNKGYKFFGYLDNQDTTVTYKSKVYGFLMNANELISIGQHTDDGQLQGIGRYYTSDGVQDGMFRQGKLKGIGIKFTRNGNKYSLGQHDGQSSLQKGFGFPSREICQIRKQFHLRSIYFYNDVVVIGIYSQLYSILMHSLNAEEKKSFLQHNANHHQMSPKFSSIKENKDRSLSGKRDPGKQFPPRLSANSPIRAKINKYQRQSQRIQDPSPVKGKVFHEYQPTDHRAVKYFSIHDNQEIQDDPQQEKYQDPPIIKRQRQQQAQRQRQSQRQKQRILMQRQRQLRRQQQLRKKKAYQRSKSRQNQRSGNIPYKNYPKTQYERISQRQKQLQRYQRQKSGSNQRHNQSYNHPTAINRRNKYLQQDQPNSRVSQRYQDTRTAQNNYNNIYGKKNNNNSNPKYDNYIQDSRNNNKSYEVRQRRDSRFNNNKKQTAVAKDTRQLVRQLQQQQRRKRLDLDKIYKQAGLYRRR